jgi:Uma2 family endonuclease
MSESSRLVTAAELEKFPDDDRRYELVDGRIVRMSPVGYQHGRVVARLATLLERHTQSRGLGVVLAEVGFTLGSNPDTVRAPDIAFLQRGRVPSTEPRGFWKGPPDLAIEVLSPEDRPSEVVQKIEEYMARGVSAVLIVDPDERTATVHRPLQPPATLRSNERLDLGDVVPGFRCSVRDLFD